MIRTFKNESTFIPTILAIVVLLCTIFMILFFVDRTDANTRTYVPTRLYADKSIVKGRWSLICTYDGEEIQLLSRMGQLGRCSIFVVILVVATYRYLPKIRRVFWSVIKRGRFPLDMFILLLLLLGRESCVVFLWTILNYSWSFVTRFDYNHHIVTKVRIDTVRKMGGEISPLLQWRKDIYELVCST